MVFSIQLRLYCASKSMLQLAFLKFWNECKSWKCYVLQKPRLQSHVFTYTDEVETIKTVTYGYWPKSVSTGLCCNLACVSSVWRQGHWGSSCDAVQMNLTFPCFCVYGECLCSSLQRSCCLLMWLTPTRGVCGRPEIEDLWRTSRCIASWRRWLQKHWMSSRTTLRGLKRRRKRYCGYIVFMSSLWQSWWWPAFLENWRNSNTAGRKSRGKQKVGKSCIIFFRKKVALCSTLLYVHYCTGFCDGPN